MVAIKAYFDGKVIVPDEPLDLPPNQRVIVHVEPEAESAARAQPRRAPAGGAGEGGVCRTG